MLIQHQTCANIEQPRRPIEGPEEFKFPYSLKMDQLGGYVDAAHAGCLKTRNSVGGYVLMFPGVAVAYKAKWIPIVVCFPGYFPY